MDGHLPRTSALHRQTVRRVCMTRDFVLSSVQSVTFALTDNRVLNLGEENSHPSFFLLYFFCTSINKNVSDLYGSLYQ